jgi:hypothetical protein
LEYIYFEESKEIGEYLWSILYEDFVNDVNISCLSSLIAFEASRHWSSLLRSSRNAFGFLITYKYSTFFCINNILCLRKVQYVCIGNYAGKQSLSMDYATVKITKQRRI